MKSFLSSNFDVIFMTDFGAEQPLNLPRTEDKLRAVEARHGDEENLRALLFKPVKNTLIFIASLIHYCEERSFLIFLLLIAYCGWFILCKTSENIANTLFIASEHSIDGSNNLKAPDAVRKWLSEEAFYTNNLNKAPDAARKRLKEQALEVRLKAIQQFERTKYFYRQFFVAISMSAIGAVISAVTLFTISKSGWDNCKNKSLITIFVVSSGITIFFSSSIFIFQLENNIAENKKLYLGYAALEDRILSYFATEKFRLANLPTSETSSKVSASVLAQGFINDSSEVISYIDGELAAINNIAIGFDVEKIPNYQDMQKLTNEAAPENSGN